MVIPQLSHLAYRVVTLLRFLIAFVAGYFYSVELMLLLNRILLGYLTQAESVFLAALISLIFYLIFVLMIFMIHSFKKIIIISMSLLLLFGSIQLWV